MHVSSKSFSGRKIVSVVVSALLLGSLSVTAPAGGALKPRGLNQKLRAGRNYRLQAPPMPTRFRDVPALAVDPDNSRHIVAISQEYRFEHCSYHVSFDQGKTWKTGNLRGPEGWPQPYCTPLDEGGYSHLNATVVFGSKDNVYTAFSAAPPDGADSILLAKSTNGGRTFRRGVVVIRGQAAGLPAPEPDVSYIQPTVNVVPGKRGQDKVYIASWGRFPFSGGCSRQARERGACNDIVSAVSTDGGKTFNGPVDVDAPDELAREQSQPMVGKDGTIYIAYRQRQGGAGGVPLRSFLRLATSTDRGQTWSRQTISEEKANLFPGLQPRMAINKRNGTLYIAYQANTNDNGDIFLRRSTDKGATWSDPVRVNDDPKDSGAYQSAPDVVVGPKGRVDMVWYDQRHAYPGALSVSPHSGASIPLEDTYFATSYDGGRTFSKNLRVSDRTRNLDIGLRDEANFGPFWGGVTAPIGKNKALVAWADSRLGNVINDSGDIFLAKVNLAAKGPAPVRRLKKANPVDMSVALSRLAYPGGGEDRQNRPATRVIVVNRSDVAAALAGAVLARLDAGPVLLSGRNRLPKVVRKEVARLAKPAGAYLIGDESALSNGVKDDLAGEDIPEDKIQRIAGSSSADTARLIANVMDTRNDSDKSADKAAFSAAMIVNPKSNTASAGTALAAALRLPVLFAERGTLPDATKQALNELDIANTLVLGNQKVIGEGVLGQLPSAKRLGGKNASRVSRAVARASQTQGQPKITLANNVVYVADAGRPMYGAILGAAVARLGGLELLVPGASTRAARKAIDALKMGADVDHFVKVKGK